MSTLAFSAGMAAPLVYLSFSFYDRYGFSKNLIVRIFIVALLLCIGFFRRKLFDALLKQGAYSFFYCAAWFLALIPTTVLNAADILRPMCRRQKAEEQLP